MRKLFTRTGTVTVAAVALTGVGVAFAAWTATGTGTGTAKAVEAKALTTTAVVAGDNAATLYPGSPASAGVLKITVNNPNPYPVSVTSVTRSTDGITSDKTDCAGDNVSWTAPAQQSAQPVAANSSSTWTLTGVAMVADAADACQGATFTIPVALSGASAAITSNAAQ